MNEQYKVNDLGFQIIDIPEKEVKEMDYWQDDLQLRINELTRKFNEWIENSIYELMKMVNVENLYDLQSEGYEIKIENIQGTSNTNVKLFNLITGNLIYGYLIKVETSFKDHGNFVHSSEMKVTREPILYHGGK